MRPGAAYTGRLLRVDLSTGEWAVEPLDGALADQCLGGRALGARLLYDEVHPATDPLGTANKLIFTTGPLVGTLAPSTARWCVSTKSPQTGIYLFSICSGNLGVELKKSGFDVLVVEGRSETPVYLRITNGRPTLSSSAHLWGLDTFSTQEVLQQELKRFGTHSLACIGPAGEQLSKMACIISGRRAAGRGGPGAVMGAKNLKAIAVRGIGDVTVADLAGFMTCVNEARRRIDAAPFLRQALSRYGSAVSVGLVNERGMLPTRNWQSGVFADAQGILPQSFRENAVIKDLACPTCPIGCSKLCAGTDGSVSEGPEYETIYAFGSACGIGDIGRIVQADLLCDQLGLDTIAAGVTIAFVMECFQKGLVTSEQLDGLPVEFGRGEVLPVLLRKMALREGIGDLLADGVLLAQQRLAVSDDSFAMHAKGMELGGYDPRGAKSQALVFGAGPRGGCHHANGYVITAELASGLYDRFSVNGKGGLVRGARDLRTVLDSTITCAFAGIANGLDITAELLAAATGDDWDMTRLVEVGERCSNLERAYNGLIGIRREHDTLPGRLLHEPLLEGASSGQIVEMDALLDDFYATCGWDIVSGLPTEEKLRELGLADVADDLAEQVADSSLRA